jgi:hypothetical protein
MQSEKKTAAVHAVRYFRQNHILVEGSEPGWPHFLDEGEFKFVLRSGTNTLEFEWINDFNGMVVTCRDERGTCFKYINENTALGYIQGIEEFVPDMVLPTERLEHTPVADLCNEHVQATYMALMNNHGIGGAVLSRPVWNKEYHDIMRTELCLFEGATESYVTHNKATDEFVLGVTVVKPCGEYKNMPQYYFGVDENADPLNEFILFVSAFDWSLEKAMVRYEALSRLRLGSA